VAVERAAEQVAQRELGDVDAPQVEPGGLERRHQWLEPADARGDDLRRLNALLPRGRRVEAVDHGVGG